MWTWMDQNPAFHFCVVGGLIGLALIMAIIPLLRDHGDEKRSHDWIWGILLVAILAAGRWPSILFPRELNPDEGQLLAGARALLKDPVFWRSVDGGTVGPMGFFALWPAGWIFGWQTYLTARITGLAALSITFVLAHQGMTRVLGRKIARVASLSAVCLEALTNAPDLLHYSTELVPMAMLTVAAYAATRRWLDQPRPLWNAVGGLLLGAIPLAKLQVAPLAACLGFGWLVAEIFTPTPERSRRITWLLLGAFLPVCLFAFQLTLAGEWNNVITSYLLSNIGYSGFSKRTLSQLLRAMYENSVQADSLLHLWVPGSAIWLALMMRVPLSADRAIRRFMLAGFAATLLALYSISFTRQDFLHYWQLAIVPVTFLTGAVIGNLLSASPQSWLQRNRWLVAMGVFGLIGTLLIHRAQRPNPFLGYHALFEQTPHTALCSRIIPHIRADDSLAIWGWSNYVYVETGLRQATRDTVVYILVEPGPYRDFYRQRYLNDFINALPTFFLDSVGPWSALYQRVEYSHDRSFPALAAVIRSHYVLIEETSGARLYQRKDLVNR